MARYYFIENKTDVNSCSPGAYVPVAGDGGAGKAQRGEAWNIRCIYIFKIRILFIAFIYMYHLFPPPTPTKWAIPGRSRGLRVRGAGQGPIQLCDLGTVPASL